MTTLYRDLNQIITLDKAHAKDGRNLNPTDLGIIENGAVIFNDKEILWTGSSESIPSDIKIDEEKSLRGFTLTPELVDSHTHLIFGGDRAFEYSMRLNGESYEAIAKSGGGILNTAKGTQSLSEEELFKICCERIDRINSHGVGTIEIKSGYGLNKQTEILLSKVIHKLKKHYSPRVQIYNTFMAAHAVPKEFNSSAEYISQLVIPLLEELAPQGIIDAVDIFHEEGYFTAKDVKVLFEKAKELGINRKIHADEFNDNKGALLACEYEALSADHLLCSNEDAFNAFSKSNTVATLLPGTGYFLGKPQANARKLLDAGAKVAIASDYNPGSCNVDNVLLLASVAAPNYKMNISELWCAITLNAAHALGYQNQGALIKGMKPRFSLFEVPSIDYITYNWGKNYSKNLSEI